MTPSTPPKAPPAGTRPAAAPAPAGEQAVKPKSADLGIAERRKFIRPLPVPLAEESDRDSAWATFQELSSDKPKT